MVSPSIQFQPFDARSAGDRGYVAFNTFENQIRAEELPDDPPKPLEEEVQSLLNTPDYVDVHRWILWNPDGSAIIARGRAEVKRFATNQHIMDFHIAVLPEFRRQGLGLALLAPIVKLAQQEERRLLFTYAYDHVTGGAAFMQRLGASPGLSIRVNQLVLADLDRTLLHQWQSGAVERHAEFSLGWWDGAYPSHQLEEMVRLYIVGMNTMPHDQLDVQDEQITPQQARQREQYFAATGTVHWTLYATARQTGSLAGFTEIFWNPNRPQIVRQGFTCVLPEYRNHGLGRWLKAVMLEKILNELPQVRFVQTGNAHSNAPMLKINLELGFAPYSSLVVWQVETQQVAAYLGQIHA